MAAYVVMEKGGASARTAADAVFVRDGFHWVAFLVPAVWMLWHRLWLEAVLALDIYLVMGSVLIGSLLLLIGNLLADVALALSDPRIDLGGTARSR